MRSLYHLPLSPFCRKVRLLLAEKKLKVDLIEEPVWEKRYEFIKKSPASKVPLLLWDNVVIPESNAIFQYVEETYPNPPMLPTVLVDRVEAIRFVSWFDDTFHRDVTSKLLYQRVYSKLSRSLQADPSLMKSGMIAMKHHLNYVDTILDERRWLAGDIMTVADFAGAAHISSLDYMGDIDWNGFTSIKNWYAKIKSRPAFRSLLMDYLPTLEPPKHYSDLDF